MVEKVKNWFYQSLYMQIGLYICVSLIVCSIIFLVVKMIGNYIYFNDKNVEHIVQERLDMSFASLKKDIESSDEEIYTTLEKWIYQNKYYILYLINDDGSLYYTNDGSSVEGNIERLFPNVKLNKMNINGVEKNVTITYLFAAEVNSKIIIGSLVSAVVVGLITFVLLFKSIVDRIKKVSFQLEIISGEDSEVLIYDRKQDELGTLVANLNQMRNNLMNQYDQVEKLENKQYQNIAVLSHDIRTPLTVMKGYLEIIRNSDSEQDIHLYLVKFDEKLLEIEHLSLELFENLKVGNCGSMAQNIVQGMNQVDFKSEMIRFREDIIFSEFKVNLTFPDETNGFVIKINLPQFRQLLTSIHSNLVHYADKDYPTKIDCKIDKLFLRISMTNQINHNQEQLISSKQGLNLQKNVLREINGDLKFFCEDNTFFLTIKIPRQ